MDCTKCHQQKELAKGKKWCKDCKNLYEKNRRRNLSSYKKSELRFHSKLLYENNKNKVEVVILDDNKTKKCSICNIEKPQTSFFIAKCKGNIRAMCKDCSSIKRKEYYKNNKDKVIKQTNNYKIEKMKKDPLFKLERMLRCRIYHAFKAQGHQKNNRTWKYLDCSANFFQSWIKYQLYDGMTFENYGAYWHIDHVKPCTLYNLSNVEEVKECFCWKNLRPLRADKNKKKSGKFILNDILFQELKVKCFLKEKV